MGRGAAAPRLGYWGDWGPDRALQMRPAGSAVGSSLHMGPGHPLRAHEHGLLFEQCGSCCLTMDSVQGR